jgi:hypothetical protein
MTGYCKKCGAKTNTFKANGGHKSRSNERGPERTMA